MSIGGMAGEGGISIRSPSKGRRESFGEIVNDNSMGESAMDDVELGAGLRRSNLAKAKESDLEPLVTRSPDRMEANPRGPSDAEQSSASKSLIASAMYSGCSVGMVLVNKSLASR